MKINDKKTIVAKFTSENLDNEMILYNEYSHKIIVLNQIATFIWNQIIECYKSNKNVHTKEIANKIIKICGISDTEFDAVVNDVDETIISLYKSSLLIIHDD